MSLIYIVRSTILRMAVLVIFRSRQSIAVLQHFRFIRVHLLHIYSQTFKDFWQTVLLKFLTENQQQYFCDEQIQFKNTLLYQYSEPVSTSNKYLTNYSSVVTLTSGLDCLQKCSTDVSFSSTVHSTTGKIFFIQYSTHHWWLEQRIRYKNCPKSNFNIRKHLIVSLKIVFN